MEFGLLLRLVGVMSLMLMLCRSFQIQGREPYLYDFVNKNNKTTTTTTKHTQKQNVGLYSNIYRAISFKLDMVIETAKLN